MSGKQDSSDYATNPSIFLRLNAADTQPREVAWLEFHQRYSPIIAGFARNLGARSQDIDDVIQDVLLGFYGQSPQFVYDASRGRFRGYLKVCTCRALKRRMGQNARFNGVPLDDVDPESPDIDGAWNRAWEKQLLSRAVERLRKEIGGSRRFIAFERHILQNMPAEQVAEDLGVHVNSVYRAAEQMSGRLKSIVSAMSELHG
jgi:RNA polymerase sigma factor (sigma-70 family)